jgi:NAD(P)-dependent dehydrogenase (short-subunit alcohol dehydrogenase family)
VDGKTVLITGSTDGVGRYVTARLAAAGAKVLIHGRDGARVGELARRRAAKMTYHEAIGLA